MSRKRILLVLATVLSIGMFVNNQVLHAVIAIGPLFLPFVGLLGFIKLYDLYRSRSKA